MLLRRNNEYEHKASSLLDSEGSVHSFRDVFKSLCLRRIQRRLWLLGNNSRSANPSSSSVHCCHRISHSMASGMGWGDPVHRFGVVLSGLELGTIPLERWFGNFRPLGLDRCSFSVQLDIQSTAANAIVAT